VVLDGQGADETLGGLPLYERALLRSWLRGLRFIKLAGELSLRRRRYGLSWPTMLKQSLFLKPQPALLWAPPIPAMDSHVDQDEALHRLLVEQVTRGNLPTVLEQQYHNSMRHSIESRLPFLDHKVVEAAMAMPDEQKINEGIRKRPLFDLGRKLLPPAVAERTNKRMIVSDQRWADLRREGKAQLEAWAASPQLRESQYWDGAAASRYVSDFLLGHHENGLAVWRLYTASRWMEMFHAR